MAAPKFGEPLSIMKLVEADAALATAGALPMDRGFDRPRGRGLLGAALGLRRLRRPIQRQERVVREGAVGQRVGLGEVGRERAAQEREPREHGPGLGARPRGLRDGALARPRRRRVARLRRRRRARREGVAERSRRDDVARPAHGRVGGVGPRAAPLLPRRERVREAARERSLGARALRRAAWRRARLRRARAGGLLHAELRGEHGVGVARW